MLIISHGLLHFTQLFNIELINNIEIDIAKNVDQFNLILKLLHNQARAQGCYGFKYPRCIGSIKKEGQQVSSPPPPPPPPPPATFYQAWRGIMACIQ